MDGSFDPGHRANSCIVGVRAETGCQRPSSLRTFFFSLPTTSAVATQAARALARLLLEQVRAVRLAPPDLPRARDAEPLGGSAVGLHLRHHVAPLSSGGERPRRPLPRRWRSPRLRPSRGRRSATSVTGTSATGASASCESAFFVRSGLAFCRFLLGGVQDHGHVAAVLAWLRLDHRDVTDVFGDPAKDPHAELRVRHLTPAEHDRELDLVALAQEPHHVLHLGDVVVLVDLGPELHLLDDDVRGLALRLSTPLFLLVDVPP